MLRIGYETTATVLNRAGEARYARDLLLALGDREDISVAPLTPTRRRPRSLFQRILLQAAVQGGYQPFVLPRQARAARVDVVHYPRHLTVPAPGFRPPAVVTIHDVLALSHPEWFSREIRANFGLVVPALLRRVDRVVTGSEFTRRQIVEWLDVDAEKIAVTPLGLDRRFRPAPLAPEILCERFGIERPYVLCVGTMEVRKNLAGALRAFARLAGEGLDHQLVVTGGRGWMNEEFDRLVRAMPGQVVTTGYVSDEDLVGLLSSAACFVYPSLAEGFGFPPLEAMACATPVVTSDRGSLPEVVGDAAVLVEPDDEGAIAAAVRRVLDEPGLAADLRARGTRRASRYTWARCADLTVDVYRAALASRRA